MADQKSEALVPETVITSRRRHWINLVPIMAACIILMFFLLGFSHLYEQNQAAVDKVLPVTVLASLAGIYVMIVSAIALLSIWIYYQNRLVLTNRHMIEHTRSSVIDRSVAQFSLVKLQDVSAEQHGLWANLLGYGSIVVETAGEEENFTFKPVARPQELANQIMQAQEALTESISGEARSV